MATTTGGEDEGTTFFVGKLHLGDTPVVPRFGDAVYVGLRLCLPVRVYIVDEPPPRVVTLVFRTSEVESWAAWQRHTVSLGGRVLGTLGDADHPGNPSERHVLTIRTEELRGLLQTGKPLVLEIAVGTGTPGSADDFVLKEIAASGAVFVVGW